MKKIFILVSFFLLSFSAHKFYVSLTDINFSEEDKSLQITTNIFIDDLEKAIDKEFSIKSNFGRPKEILNIDTYLKKYLNKHLEIEVDNKKSNFKYLGKEFDGDIVFFFLEIENVRSFKKIDFTNTILIEHFPEQKNLIKVKYNSERKSIFLDKINKQGSIHF